MNYYNEKIKINEEYLRGLTATELCETNTSYVEKITIDLKMVTNDEFGTSGVLQVTTYDIEGRGKFISVVVDDQMTHDEFRDRLIGQLQILETMIS